MTKTHLSSGSESAEITHFNRLIKYVRVRSAETARFVEFDFAIGDPSLFVELIMPRAVFEDFCEKNQVVHMTDEQVKAVDAEMEKWRYGEDSLMAQNHDRAIQ